MKLILILSLFFTFPVVAQQSLDQLLTQYNTRSIPYISVEELRMLQMKKKIIILDAREKNEFNVSHVKDAKFVGFNNFSSEEILKEITNKDAQIVVYCSLGIRSEQIGKKLKKAGYNNVQNLYGGIFEWKNKGFPIFDSQNVETEKVHAFSKVWGKWLKSGIKVYDIN